MCRGGEGGTASKSCKHTCVEEGKGALLVNRLKVRLRWFGTDLVKLEYLSHL